MADICNALDELPTLYTIDISQHDKISNPDLREHIERVGKVFYKKV